MVVKTGEEALLGKSVCRHGVGRRSEDGSWEPAADWVAEGFRTHLQPNDLFVSLHKLFTSPTGGRTTCLVVDALVLIKISGVGPRKGSGLALSLAHMQPFSSEPLRPGDTPSLGEASPAKCVS